MCTRVGLLAQDPRYASSMDSLYYVRDSGTKLNTFFSVLKVYNDENLLKIRYKHCLNMLAFVSLSNICSQCELT